jgi:hypothetical protein
MSIKSMQNLYKILSHELSSNLNDSTNNSTPSKRNTKDNLAKSVETGIMSLKTPL